MSSYNNPEFNFNQNNQNPFGNDFGNDKGPNSAINKWTIPQRTHVLSFLIHASKIVPSLFFIYFIELDTSSSPSNSSGVFSINLIIIYLFVIFIILFISWRFRTFWIKENELIIQHRFITKNIKHIPLDRIQAIDIIEPLLGRVIGLAALRISSGATSMSGKSLIAYLKTSDAKELREILLRQRQYVLEHEGSLENKTENSFSSYVPDSSSITADYSAQPLNHNSTLDSIYNISDYGFINYWYQLTTEELSVAVVSPFIIPLIAIGFFAFLMNSTDGFIKTAGISIGILVPYIISILVELWRRYSRFAGYKIERLDRGLRITSGLLTVNHETVPYGRIQAFRIEQPFLWKIFGLFRLQINLAGTSTKTKVNRQNLIMLPACKFQTAVSFIQIILPQVDFDIPMIPPPKIAFFKGLFWAKAHRVGLSQDIAIVSYGIFRRHWDIVNYKKIQSLRIRKGPINRLLNLNTLHIDTANGPVKFKIKWRSNFDASQVFSFLTDSVVVQHTL